MKDVSSPVKLKEALSLVKLGVSPSSLTFSSTTMSSSTHIVVRERNSLLILSTRDPQNPVRRPVVSDSALMHPSKNWIALKTGMKLQVFDMGRRKVFAEVVTEEAVEFWKWVDEETMGVVTSTAAFHWGVARAENSSGETGLQKMFERHSSLANAQIINYITDESQQWLCVVGISRADARVDGHIQLYSVVKGLSQALDGHAAAFRKLRVGAHNATFFVFASRKPDEESPTGYKSKLHIIEVATKEGDSPVFQSISEDLYFTPEYPLDYPLSLMGSDKFPTILYMMTKSGFIHLYDLLSAACLYQNRISTTTCFATVPHPPSGGVMTLNREGTVFLFAPNPSSFISYVLNKLDNRKLAESLASYNGFTGAEDSFVDRFEDAMDRGDYREAAIACCRSPGGRLRSRETLQRLQELQQEDNSPPPILTYLYTCLERGPLNEVESFELTRALVKRGKTSLMEKWIKENKLHFSEELGDLVRSASPSIALAVFIKCKAHRKVIEVMIQMGNHSKVAQYAAKVGMAVDHVDLVEMVAKYDSKAALRIAGNSVSNALVLSRAKEVVVDVPSVKIIVDSFLSKGMLNEAVKYAVESLSDESPSEGPLQTKILEACLVNQPRLADGILSQDIWHQYDETRIAILCERAGLYQHALENFKDLADVKRVITNTHVINPDFLLNYFSTISSDDALEVLEEILRSNPRANIRIAVRIATRYTEAWGGAEKVMKIFEVFASQIPDSLYYYLASVVLVSSEAEVHNRFVEVAVKLGQYGDAEKVTRESAYIDPDRLKNFLMQEKCKDPRPLMNVCDRFGFIPELVRYLVRMRQLRFVEGYVQRVHPANCPEVVGALLDLDAMDSKEIEKLILSVKNMVPVDKLVQVVEERGKLKLILKLLESRIADGSTEEPVHTGVAKVYVDGNVNPEHFLKTNPYYDSLKVGLYCSRRDPYLAYISFARGKCDAELVDLTNENSLFKEQARYVTDRADADLWARVMDPENPFRKLVVDQIINTALPETNKPEKVAAAVKAFLAADMPEVLMDLLERLVLQISNTAFSRNSNLQNLLILTAIRSRPVRVMEYIRILDDYDGPDLAPSCLGEGLFEEAYTIYYKFEMYDEAVDILITHLKDFDRANEFAVRINSVEVWLKLGVAELESGIVADGIMCLLRARNFDRYFLVCSTAQSHAETDEDFQMVVKFCRVARKKLWRSEHALQLLDAELVYSLCRLNRLTDVEEFIVTTTYMADLDKVGDRCFEDSNFLACRLLYSTTSNWPKLAHTHIKLGEYEAAVDAAKKAKRIPTWRIVCFGCVDGLEFKLAAVCALKLLVEVEEMQECIEYYEDRGHFDEIISVMEYGINLDRAHQAMYTEFIVLLTKYQEDRVFDQVRTWHSKINVQQAIRACKRAMLWDVVAYLYVQYNEYENAAVTMMEHSPTAFDHNEFQDVIARAGVLELYYESISFYIDEQPELLPDLLRVLAPRVDATRAVRILKSACKDLQPLGCVPFASDFLLRVQRANMPEVNEAINDLFVAEENTEALQLSVDSYDNFDTLALAKRLKEHNLLKMRRIASHLLARSGRHEQAIEISKDDKLYADVVYAIKESKDEELAEMYATWFIEQNLAECFCALLYECYEFFPPDVAMQFAWSGGVRDLAMPFMIQTLAEAGRRLTSLEDERKTAREKEAERQREEEEEINEDVSVLLYGLQPQHQQLLIGYGQTDMHGALGHYNPYGAGSALPMIGWNEQNAGGALY